MVKTENLASRIPSFRTIAEEAEFWDTHDITEFADELDEVTDVVFGSVQSKDALVLRFVGDDLTALVERAREEDVSPATLVRGWVLERLDERSSRSQSGR
ncbi:MAG: CopG family antitoxin [Thermomicrobiales bacterium]